MNGKINIFVSISNIFLSALIVLLLALHLRHAPSTPPKYQYDGFEWTGQPMEFTAGIHDSGPIRTLPQAMDYLGNLGWELVWADGRQFILRHSLADGQGHYIGAHPSLKK